MENATGISVDSPLNVLDGIGKTRAAAFARIDIHDLGELVSFYPRAYENRGDIKLLTAADADAKQAVMLTVATAPKRALIRRGMSLLKFRAYDDSASAELTYFNQDYLKDFFVPGKTYRFYGKVEHNGNKYGMSNPIAERADGKTPLHPLLPVYRLTDGLSQKMIFQSVRNALALTASTTEEILPSDIILSNGLCTLSFALRNIHLPDSYKSLAAAKKRLIFDEFFMFALGITLTRDTERQRGAPVCSENDITPLTDILPYPLTGAQERTIEDIKNDMARDVPMCRMVVGDVGCGKTVCAVAAMFIAVKSGKQAMLMAPTGILAHQHYSEISRLSCAFGFTCRLLTGTTPKREKDDIYRRLSSQDKSERIDIIIGTHALISENVKLFSPGLVITDEQHRFGVNQRALLSGKGEHVHTLVMSATPIPRSLALTLYGDLDLSVIDEMPPGRQKVDTYVINESYRERLNVFIEKKIAEGGQVYIVCPEVDETIDLQEKGELDISSVRTSDGEMPQTDACENIPKAAVTHCAELQKRFSDFSVAYVHGKMKSAEKDAVMSDFVSGKTQILVSTTVIEVGVNVPNACLMIIENADKFGLSQLHQLRGRVGRGKRKSYCVLVSASDSPKATERLEVMRSVSNGFEIAEKDLQSRGPGDFMRNTSEDGIRQSGTLRFRLADMCENADLLKSAFASARSLLESDPSLSLPENAKLRAAVGRMFTLQKNKNIFS